MTDNIRAEAARQLERLRVSRGLEARAPHTLGRLFPPTRGVPLSEHEPAPLVPMPLEEWVAASDPDAGWGSIWSARSRRERAEGRSGSQAVVLALERDWLNRGDAPA